MRDVRMYNPTHRFPQHRQQGPSVDPSVRWSHQLQDWINEVAVWGDTVYLAVNESKIVAIGADGTTRWRFHTDGRVMSSPAVVDGTLYVGDFDDDPTIMGQDDVQHNDVGTVYAMDAASGSEQWRYQTDGNVRSSPAVVDDTVYVGSDNGNVYALDAAKGTKRWRFDGKRNYHIVSPAVVDDTVYVGGSKGYMSGLVYALDATNGLEQWHFRTYGDWMSSPTVVDGTVYVGSEEHVYAVDTASGTEQWRFQAESSVEYSSPAVVDGTVYVGCERNVYALEGVDGTEQWRFQTYGVGSPVVVDGTVYVGSRSPRVDDTVYALSAAEGTEQWTFQTVGTVRSSLAVIDGTIYVGSRDNVEGGRRGTVYALGGEQLGTNTKVYSDSLCSNCGTDLSDHGDPNFCPECGAETDISEKSKTQVFDQ